MFIIWQSGEDVAQKIIDDISNKFQIIDATTIHWQRQDVCSQLNRLYPHRKFDYSAAKVKEIGADKNGVRLHFIIVRDLSPITKNDININLHNLKKIYREKFNTNFLHSTDNQADSLQTINRLLNFSRQKINDLNKLDKSKFLLFNQNKNILMKSEVITFNTISELFQRLNDYKILYVVLRNWEILDQDIVSLEHSDVDLLVEDYYNTILALNAKKANNKSYRVQYIIKIGKSNIPFDIRYVGDKYYDSKWAENIVKTRMNNDFFFIPNNENYYYSLLYHALIHKPSLSTDYYNRLMAINPIKPDMKNLKSFLKANNYKITRPLDKSVHYVYSYHHLKYILYSYLKKSKYLYTLYQKIRNFKN